MSKHAVRSPSSAKRWLSCPGSINLCEALGLGDSGSSRAAEEGTAAHELAERILTSGTEGVELVGLYSDNGWEFTDEMRTEVMKYVNFVRDTKESMGPGTHMLIEVQVPISHLTGE